MSKCFSTKQYGGHSSVGRASDCGSECRGFEPHSPPQGCHQPLNEGTYLSVPFFYLYYFIFSLFPSFFHFSLYIPNENATFFMLKMHFSCHIVVYIICLALSLPPNCGLVGERKIFPPLFFFISQKLFSLVKVKYPKNKKK